MYAEICCPTHSETLAFSKRQMERISRRIEQLVWDKKIKPGDVDPQLVEEQLKGFFDSLSLLTKTGPMDREALELANKMRSSAFTLNVFRNHKYVTELADSLIGDDGKLLPFSKWKKRAKQISSDYNKHWLETEYNTARRGAQMAQKWQTYESGKDVLPYLRYRAIMDDRTRPAHAQLNDLVAHVDDPIWDRIFPPNGWNCRCDVDRVEDPGDFGPDDLGDDVPVDPRFQLNTGKTGSLYDPKRNPYFNVDTSDSMYGQLDLQRVKQALDPRSYLLHRSYPSMGQILVHFDFGFKKDYEELIDVADKFAQQGRQVYLLPRYNKIKSNSGEEYSWIDLYFADTQEWCEVKIGAGPRKIISHMRGAVTQLKKSIDPSLPLNVVVRHERFIQDPKILEELRANIKTLWIYSEEGIKKAQLQGKTR